MASPKIVFDFDGVLCDSLEECLIVSWHAYRSEGADGAGRPPEAWAEQFRKFRFLVRTAGEYLLLWDLIAQGQTPNEGRFAEHPLRQDRERMETYRRVFFTERKLWREADPEGWLRHNPLYPGICELLNDPGIAGLFFVVSSKDETAMEEILRRHGIPVARNRLLGSETGFDKDLLMRRLMEEFRIAPRHLYFIDDNLTNILTAKGLGLNPILAEWGYNSESERALAAAERIECLPLHRLASRIDEIMG
jgi:phosphoglycolate phosphatase-like HAD superfamily hydrolase